MFGSASSSYIIPVMSCIVVSATTVCRQQRRFEQQSTRRWRDSSAVARLQSFGDSLTIAGKCGSGAGTGSGAGSSSSSSSATAGKGRDALALYRYMSSASPPPQPRVNVYMFGRMVYAAAGTGAGRQTAAFGASRSPLALKT